MNKKTGYSFAIFLITVTFLFTSLLSVNTAEEMSGVSRVVNYAGIVRGATQRLVKFEITHKPNDELIRYLDDILNDLRFDAFNKYNLKTLDDDDYNDKLDILNTKWIELKKEILVLRKDNINPENLLYISEEHFLIANETVTLAENYGESASETLSYIKKVLNVTIIILLIALILIFMNIIHLKRESRKFEQLSNIDVSTNLPNKNRCEQLLASYGVLNPKIEYGLIMLDLNNLKVVNDSCGHRFGDELISSFAKILNSVTSKDTFAGRFGGDEFIVIFESTSKESIELYIDSITTQVNKFNLLQENTCLKISFAAGYAWTHNVEGVTMEVLFATADENMYANKKRMKSLILQMIKI